MLKLSKYPHFVLSALMKNDIVTATENLFILMNTTLDARRRSYRILVFGESVQRTANEIPTSRKVCVVSVPLLTWKRTLLKTRLHLLFPGNEVPALLLTYISGGTSASSSGSLLSSSAPSSRLEFLSLFVCLRLLSCLWLRNPRFTAGAVVFIAAFALFFTIFL